jgi:divinyl protochlorophyllide a 8-vinyl-reductase
MNPPATAVTSPSFIGQAQTASSFMRQAQPAPASSGRIGPNAIIRVAQALPAFIGSAATCALFERAGLAGYLRELPEHMVDETEVQQLHAELRRSLGPEMAAQVARSAGRRTADYLLAHRIPKPVQTLLKALPARLSAHLLLTAVRRHAWTFAGSGVFSARTGHPGSPVVLTIRDNPLCKDLTSETPACDFYAATFERLFQVLVARRARVLEVACEACGDAECRFEVRW